MRIGWVLGLGPYLRAPVELLDFRKPSQYQGQRRFPNFVGCHSRNSPLRCLGTPKAPDRRGPARCPLMTRRGKDAPMERSNGEDDGEKMTFLAGNGLTPSEAGEIAIDVNIHTLDTLKDKLGLSPHELTKIVSGNTSILSSPVEKLERLLSFYLDVLRFSKEEMKSLVLKDPTILRLSVDNLREKMRFFMEDIGLRRLQLTKLMWRNPQLMGSSVEDKMRANVVYLKGAFMLSPTRLKRMIVAMPSLLSYSVEDNLKPKVAWLEANVYKREGQLRKVLTQHPQILSLSVESLSAKVAWIRQRFGLDDLALQDMIAKNPSILLYNAETGIQRKDELGVTEAQVLKMLVRSPKLLSLGVESLRRKQSYFEDGLQLNADDVSSFVSRCPQVLGYGVDAMESKLLFLMQGLSATREEAVSIIFKYPQLLNLSIEKNLKLKLDFFKGELGGSDKEVRDAIIGSPTLLGYSLKARLRRRVEVLRLLGVAPSFEEHVWLISSSTGLRFNRTVEKMVMRERGVVIKGDKEVERVMKRFRAVLSGEG